jgi:hypothetical protein
VRARRVPHCTQAGRLEKNAVLPVENFDRFSRLKPRKACDKLNEEEG